ncbi:MAG: sigma-54 dependent transcriptional regulator [Deltaproteobacteria bacterium]|nr:sigma-54 dependent transcriptional regulator [Deltaproteobacteria bacterium]
MSYPRLPVMLVDDEAQALDSFELALRSANVNNFLRCQDSRDVMPLLAEQDVEVMLLDLRMPHLSGEELLPKITSDFPHVPIIVITGADDVETAVKCMRAGAFDYIVKPVERSRLVASVKTALELRELQRQNELLRAHVLSDQLADPEPFAEIVTNSKMMKSIFQYIETIAHSPQPVFLTGETGVGKELAARAIHTASGRQGDFIAINVAGLDDNVFADTLFGHRKGAFTGADQSRTGMVEMAADGTLFLDEIGDLSPASQVKLLRFLQDGEFFPLGSDVAKRSNARVVVATNQEIETLQDSSKFRKDLYYRLRIHHVHIPPLRDRKEDLPLLLDHFLEKTAKTLEKKKPTPPIELITLLGAYHFPGNIRELESIIFDAVSKHVSGKLSMEVFKSYISKQQPALKADSKGLPLDDSAPISFSEKLPTLKQAELLLIAEAMKRSQGNQAIAAMHLGISRQALNRRLRQADK